MSLTDLKFAKERIKELEQHLEFRNTKITALEKENNRITTESEKLDYKLNKLLEFLKSEGTEIIFKEYGAIVNK